MPKETIKLSGQLAIVLKDKDGKVKDTRNVKNLVVNTGLAYIVSRMTGTTKAVMSHMGVGSGTTAAAATQTDLVTLLGSREALDSSTIGGTNNENIVYQCSFEAGDGTGAITEAGIFNAATSGDMLCRTVVPVVNKASADTMEITWTITLAAT